MEHARQAELGGRCSVGLGVAPALQYARQAAAQLRRCLAAAPVDRGEQAPLQQLDSLAGLAHCWQTALPGVHRPL
eukprot:scaffold104802_cov48-Phaeocystis_antarctica.AAC.1